MSALGLAAIAGNAAFDQNRVLKDQAYQDQQRAYQGKVMDSELSTLDARTGAVGARAGLDAAQSDATRSMVPAQTKLGLSNLSNAQGAADFAGAVQPIQQGIERAGLVFKAKEQPKEQQLASAVTDEKLFDLPRQLREAHIRGVISEDAMADNVMGNFGQILASNDKPRALKFANAVAKQNGLYPGTDGKNFVDIQLNGAKTAGGDTRAYNLVADDGTSIAVPYSAIASSTAKLKTGEYDFIHTPDGTIASGNKKTGAIAIGRPGDPNYYKDSADSKKSEMERQYAFLTSHPDGPKLSAQKATDMITKGAHKTPEDRYHIYKEELAKASIGFNRPLDFAELDRQARGLAGYTPAGSGAPGLSNTVPNPMLPSTSPLDLLTAPPK
jgi:hypothetical protein